MRKTLHNECYQKTVLSQNIKITQHHPKNLRKLCCFPKLVKSSIMFVNKHSNNWSNMPNQLVNINASISFSNSSSGCCNCSSSGRSRRRRRRRRRRSSSSGSSILDFIYTNSIATSSRD